MVTPRSPFSELTMHDTAILRRLDHVIWTIIAIVAAIVLASPLVSNFYIEWASFAVPVGASLLLAAGGWIYCNRRNEPRISSALICTAQVAAFAAMGAPLSYLAAAANLPLLDHTYDAIDQAMGLDWKAGLAWMNAHTQAHTVFALTYMSFTIQATTTVLALSFSGQLLQLRYFILGFAISALVCIAISAILPAHGPWGFYGITAADYPAITHVTRDIHLPIFDGLRDGTFRALNGLTAEGIIVFPSFHAALGVIFMVALWPVPYVRWAAVLVNVLMIVGTPIDGGHYFIDIPAGIVVAVLAFVIARAAIARAKVQCLIRLRVTPAMLTPR
jgi:hypothetical protein